MLSENEIQNLRKQDQVTEYRRQGDNHKADFIQSGIDSNYADGESVRIFLFIAGIVIALLFFIKSLFDYSLVQIEVNPLGYLVSPFLIIPFMLFRRKHKAFMCIAAILLTISIPALAGFIHYFVMHAIEMVLKYDQGWRHTYTQPDIFDITSQMYTYAYGAELGKLLNFVLPTNYDPFEPKFNLFNVCLNIFNGLVIACCFNHIFRLYRTIGSYINKKADPNSPWFDDYQTTYAYTVAVMFVTYGACMPLIIVSAGLPYGVSQLITWSIFLFPILGILLAKDNYCFKKPARQGKIITYYYILFFIALVVLISCLINLLSVTGIQNVINTNNLHGLVKFRAFDIFYLSLLPLLSFRILFKSLFQKN